MPSTPNLVLRVEGKKYAGWKTVRFVRSIEALCGGFALGVSDRWAGQSKPWPIREEDECALWVGDEPVITGYVDEVAPSFSSADHSLSVSGRDKTSSIVDCSADIGKWEFASIELKTLAEKLCEPFGVGVLVQSGLTFPIVPRISVDPGETAFETIERACRLVGALPVSDHGDLLLTRAGVSRATTDLVEGENILTGGGKYSAAGRFRTYKVMGQHRGTDDFFGDGARSGNGEATDEGVRRTERSLVVRADGNVTASTAQRRAQWEAIVRAARAQTVSIVVQGWTQSDGALWPVNALTHVRSPYLGIDADMLITQAECSQDDSSGTITTLSLVRPDAFKPEVSVKKPKGGKTGGAPWAESAGGV